MMNRSKISWRFLRVWNRNFITYKRIWKINFMMPMIEPFLYILAFGLGFTGLINEVHYGGTTLSYLRFIVPALIATTVMYHAFFETTYASFVRMYYQKTFDGILATPITLEEVIIAEIVWSATKAVAAAFLMMIILGGLGFVRFPHGLLIVPLAFVGGLAFGAVGLFFTGIIPSIEMFNVPIFLFVTPMFLFSGTFFPVSNLPKWTGVVAMFFPLHHLVELARAICIGYHETNLWFSGGYLVVFGIVFTMIAARCMRRRLIR